MTPQELKNSILQLAIQGKLVERRVEEGTGAELLEKIFAAKNAEGAKGKGEKSHAKSAKSAKVGSCVSREEISDDEKPFDIPESWEWVRLGDCTSYAAKKEKVLSTDIRPDEWSLDLEDIEKDTGRIIEFRSAKDRRIIGEKVVFHKGQILYSKLRPYLKKILVAPNDGICTPELVPFSALGGIDARYLVVVLKSPHVDFLINSVTYGVKMPRVGTETMINLLIPLPPLAEQKRIVAKIEELMPLVDRYEKAWSRLEDFNKRFPVDMQKSLFQMAIQGKLVEQREDEGTGAELLEKIFAAKNAKDAKGKGEKSHAKSAKSTKAGSRVSREEIPDNEKPFDIPESWEWARLGEISWFLDAGKSPSCLKQPVRNKEWGVITTTSIQIGFFDENQNKVLPDAFPVNKVMQIKPGDILITRAGPVNRTGVACLVKEIHYNLILSDKTVRINMTDSHIDKDYVVMVLNSQQIRNFIINLMSGMDRQQVNISQEKFKTVLIPLPPLAEQKRIVAKLEELLPLCERLKR